MHSRRTPPLRSLTRPALLTIAAAGLLALLAGCGPSAPPAGGGGPPGAGGAMAPMPAGVLTVEPTTVALTTELSGRLEAWRTAQVRARVPGIVQQRLFTEGALVKAGQPLFTLDADGFRATVASAEAGQARAEATLAQAATQLERNRPLAEARSISPQEWLATQTVHKQALAEVAGAKAALAAARVNLGHTSIKSPIGGRIGRALVTEGALVGQGETGAMAVVQQTNPLYLNITQSAADVLRLRRAVDSGQLRRTDGAAAELRVVLDDGTEYPQRGKLLFADQTVDAATGQVTLRAELPNPDGLLLPGLYVKVRLVQANAERSVRVPQQAVTRSPAGDSVLVLGNGNVPQTRTVKVGAAVGGDWVVLSGLAQGEQVVVDGFQKLRPGAPVTPVPWARPGASAAAAGNPAPAAAAGSASGPASGPAPGAARASATSGPSPAASGVGPAAAASR